MYIVLSIVLSIIGHMLLLLVSTVQQLTSYIHTYIPFLTSLVFKSPEYQVESLHSTAHSH